MSIARLSRHFSKTNNTIQLGLGSFSLSNPPIGQGGNGIVYEATLFEKQVALKFLITETTGKSKQQKLQRFLAEYFNIITLPDLTGIVRYIDYDLLKFTDEEGEMEVPIIIMKRYERSMSKVTPNNNEFESLFNFLLDAIGRVHKWGIIHRDIKPENILVEGPNFVLADFGIANYNPEVFQLRAETNSRERLGNRLFSAPEQEEAGIVPHPTMDIYAMGQFLQWYTIGKTHRGTGRQRITSVFPDFEVYDRVIDKCLENNPNNRFQSIEEIREFIRASREKNLWEYLRLFNLICRRNFPKNSEYIIHSDDINRIDNLLNDFAKNQDKFGDNLWWQNGSGNMDFTLSQTGKGKWKFWVSEYNIKEIWIHYNNDFYNDYILIHYLPSESFIVDGKETFQAAIVDDKYYVSEREADNGFAEIDGKAVDLSKHKVELTYREREEGYFFVGTRYSCVLRRENDEMVSQFIETIKTTRNLTREDFEKFSRAIRKNKHRDVERDL